MIERWPHYRVLLWSSYFCLTSLVTSLRFHRSEPPKENWVDYLPRFNASDFSGKRDESINFLTTDKEAQSTSFQAETKRAPRVVFLFLTRTGLENEELWEAFFQGAQRHQYEVLVHCVESQKCAKALAKRNVIGMQQVATVPTEYCRNLMGAMVQLLKGGLRSNVQRNDKFVFLSESTLPVKPFSHVYTELTRHGKSDFCVHRSYEWPRGVDCHVVKHSQWMVLNRNHAKIVTQNWEQINKRYHAHTFTVPMLDPKRWKISGVRTMRDSRLCTDEWGVFASIYGAVPFHSQLDDPNLNPEPLTFDADKPQGICHTFAFWAADKSSAPEVALVRALGKHWPHTRMDCKGEGEADEWQVPKCEQTHPVSVTSLDEAGARAMRESPFLFVRKFKEGIVSLSTFQSELLSNETKSKVVPHYKA